jgi:hypothetical protein
MALGPFPLYLGWNETKTISVSAQNEGHHFISTSDPRDGKIGGIIQKNRLSIEISVALKITPSAGER